MCEVDVWAGLIGGLGSGCGAWGLGWGYAIHAVKQGTIGFLIGPWNDGWGYGKAIGPQGHLF